MSKKIIGVTVGTPISPQLIKEKLNLITSVDGIKADENGNVNLTGYATEQYVEDYAQPKGNYLTEHQDISGKLDVFETDHTLSLKGGILSVNTTNDIEHDNTLPITSAGVYATVGNIEVLLKTI